jgi:hypothetical protein
MELCSMLMQQDAVRHAQSTACGAGAKARKLRWRRSLLVLLFAVMTMMTRRILALSAAQR